MPIQKTRLIATADVDRIVQGEALVVTVEIFDSISKQALDLTAVDSAIATFAGTDAAVVKTLEDGVAIDTEQSGRLAITLRESDTADMLVGEAQSWQVEVTVEGQTRILQLEDALDVVASLF